MGPAEYLNVSHLPTVDRASVACPKPEPQKRIKARRKRVQQKVTAAVRAYIFEREQYRCRCCVVRAAESMHEIHPRSLGGVVSPENSVALCGSGTTGCHGLIQAHLIVIIGRDAEKSLWFRKVA